MSLSQRSFVSPPLMLRIPSDENNQNNFSGSWITSRQLMKETSVYCVPVVMLRRGSEMRMGDRRRQKKYEIVSGTKDICTNKRTGKVTRLIKDLRGTFEFRHTPQQHKVPSEMGLLFRPLRSSHCATPALGDCHLRFKIFVGTSDGS